MQVYDNILVGIHRAFELHARGVKKINRDRIAEGYVDMMLADKSVKANIATTRAQDKMTQSLLDIFG